MSGLVSGNGSNLNRLLRQPELNVCLFAFLLNLPWELLQIQFFKGMSGLAHWDGVIVCMNAAAGDGLISLFAFWAIAYLTGRRSWIIHHSIRTTVGFMGIGIILTIMTEYWATQVDGRWSYATDMPRLPLLGTGLLPLLQWILLPPLLLWLIRRQLARA